VAPVDGSSPSSFPVSLSAVAAFALVGLPAVGESADDESFPFLLSSGAQTCKVAFGLLEVQDKEESDLTEGRLNFPRESSWSLSSAKIVNSQVNISMISLLE
jgi:hypothetical protein